jgi:hypothetical protein
MRRLHVNGESWDFILFDKTLANPNYIPEFLSLCCIVNNTEWNGIIRIRVITKLPNSEQSYKGKVKIHKYINRQNQSTTGKL